MTDHRGRLIRFASPADESCEQGADTVQRNGDACQSLARKDVVVDRAEGRDEWKHSTIAGSTAPMRDATRTMVAAQPPIRGD
jgi:hypothetical protein